MLFRGSMARELDAAECLGGAHLAWSMWPGYLRDEGGVALQAFLHERAISMSMHHSSGHASVPDLRRFVDALRPGRVVPIHTFAGDRFTDLFPRVDRRQDGEWWQV
jgi:ribonuclease J